MQVYDDNKKRICILAGYKDRAIAQTLSSGDEELSFYYPTNGEHVNALRLENYIRTKTQEYVIKKKEPGRDWIKYTCALNIEELEDYCKENDIAMPKYVWGTTVSRISMDACSIIESSCEELHEDAGGQIDDRDCKELQDMLDKWCEKQRGTDTYYVDYNVAILIGGK